MKYLLKNASQIVTADTSGKNYKLKDQLKELNVISEHSILIENGIIKDIIPAKSRRKTNHDAEIDLADKVVLPGIVECHTHTAFAGSRADEFRQKLIGITYEQIAAAGGGINKTVQSVRQASFDDLVSLIQPRINYFISQGVTTLEIKSGYGLSYYDEIKLLQVINHLNKFNKIDIIPTFLGAHTYPPEYKNDHEKYIDIIVSELIPFIKEKKLAVFCDAFCEKTAFTAEDVDLIFTHAVKNGLKPKLHTEQFNSIGGLQTALKHNAVSVDHLEVIRKEDISLLKDKETVAVLLPGVSYFLNYDYAPARELINNGVIVALATDYNPGSSHISNISMIMSLVALKMNMKIEEIINAYTINAAKALDISKQTGSIEIGKKADFSVYNTKEYSDIIYNVGKNINCMTIKNGEIIFKANKDNYENN